MDVSGIDKRGIAKLTRDLQREFDKQGPIVIPVEATTTALPPLGPATTVNNYHGPVFNADVSGAHIAWNNGTVTQSQQTTSAVASGYEALAKLVTDLLEQLPQAGLDAQHLRDTQDAANSVLREITGAEPPESGRLRRALTVLRGGLAPIATGVMSGLAAGAEDWAKAAIAGLSGIC